MSETGQAIYGLPGKAVNGLHFFLRYSFPAINGGATDNLVNGYLSRFGALTLQPALFTNLRTLTGYCRRYVRGRGVA